MSVQHDVFDFFQRYSDALTAGDVTQIAACWGVPAFVIDNERAGAITDAAIIEANFEDAVRSFQEAGHLSRRHSLSKVERLAQALISADVEWSVVNKRGVVTADDQFRYVLSGQDTESFRIRCAISAERI
jgi:hypothetical protein